MKTVFVCGGSGSGKSRFAENLLARCGAGGVPPVYIATMSPEGAEAKERIARHRAARAGKGFRTQEIRRNLASAEIPSGAAVLLECLGNLVANELFAPGGSPAATRDAVLRGLDGIARRAALTVVVSNDVASDGIDYPEETMRYIDVLAELNRTLAARSDCVVETVCGIPLWHKGSKRNS